MFLEGHETRLSIRWQKIQRGHVVHTTGGVLANQRAYSRHEVGQVLAHCRGRCSARGPNSVVLPNGSALIRLRKGRCCHSLAQTGISTASHITEACTALQPDPRKSKTKGTLVSAMLRHHVAEWSRRTTLLVYMYSCTVGRPGCTVKRAYAAAARQASGKSLSHVLNHVSSSLSRRRCLARHLQRPVSFSFFLSVIQATLPPGQPCVHASNEQMKGL